MLAPPADIVPALLSRPDSRHGSADAGLSTETLVGQLIRRRQHFGITRVGSITRLDRIGIPVVQVVRPLALSNAVSQGKGPTVIEAAASAFMEAIETWSGERIPKDRLFVAEGRSLGTQACELYRPWVHADAEAWDRTPLLWMEGWDLFEDRKLPVPAALVDTDYSACSPHPDIFPRTTTGLGAGTTMLQAVLKGSTEILERHALSHARRSPRFFDDCQIDAGSVTGPLASGILGLIRSAGLLTGIWRMPAPWSLPAYWCHVMEEPGAGALVPLPAEGSACDFTEDLALAKALLEACQARLTAISGAREDVTRQFYPDAFDRAHLAEWARGLRTPRRTLSAPADQPVAGPPGPQAPLGRVLGSLREAGAQAVLIVPLFSDNSAGIHVARVLAPPLHHGDHL